MQVKLAVLADSAHVDNQSKLHISGIFDTIWAQSFPARHLQMFLVIRLEAHPSELNMTHELMIRLVDADGKEVLKIEAGFEAQREEPSPEPASIQLVNKIVNVVFASEGDYSFDILVDRRWLESVPLKLSRRSG